MGKLISYNGKLLVDSDGHAFKYGANSGTININTNGIHDINGFANANVNVPNPSTGTLNIIANGNYDVTNKAGVNVNVPSTIKYQFTVTNKDTGAALSGATVQIKHNGSVIGTVTTNSNGIAVFESIYVSIEYVVSYSTWDYVIGTAIATEVGTVNTNVPMTDFPAPSSHTPGDTITWDNKTWLVCHYDSSKNQVYLIASDTVDNTAFGNDIYYAGSTLAARCTTYQNNSISAAALKMIVDTTVNGVTAKVFVPSYEQFNGGFSWFNSDSRREVNGAAGYYTYYWTSSAYASSGVWSVVTGSFGYNYPSFSCGFRPCVCVQL